MRVLFIGRFQPFHMGHYHAMLRLRDHHLIVGIGSAQAHGTFRNPFTAQEREEMIRAALGGDFHYEIVHLEDTNDHSRWYRLVVERCSPFDAVFTNNPVDRHIFERHGCNLLEGYLWNREHFSATEVRLRMARGEEWRDMVPEAVARIIERINGVERVRGAYIRETTQKGSE